MRIETIEIKIYTFNEASKELKDKIREYFDDGYLYDFHLDERIKTLKEYTNFINGELDYSISCVPDRGEFITIKDFDNKLFLDSLKLENCALTGHCYDDALIYYINKFGELSAGLNAYLKSIHDEYTDMLSDDYLSELCEANSYEFTIDGKLY